MVPDVTVAFARRPPVALVDGIRRHPDRSPLFLTQPRSSVFTSVRYAERRPWRTRIRIALLVLLTLVVLAAVVVVALWVYASLRISGVPVSALERADDGAENTLVVATGGDDVAGIAVVQTAEARSAPAVLLLPRELLVEVQGGGTRRLADFQADGGIAVLVDAVQDYTGIPLDHYAVVSVDGVAGLVGTLGGVPLCKVPGSEGCPVLTSDDVANRLAATGSADDDDPDRARRVHEVLRNGLTAVTRPGLLWNPLRVKRLVDGYASAVETDRDLGPRGLRRLAGHLAAVPADELAVRVVPGVREDGTVRAAIEPAEALFQAFRELEPLPDTGIEAPVELVPADVTVRVLNGVGRAGLAAEMATFLESKGFVIADTDNAAAFDRNAATTIRHAEGAQDRAELVAGFIPEVTTIEVGRVPEGVDVVVTVGSDWGSS